MRMTPLDNLLVIDFSTLLPGPMASLILAEAGARVLKIERPVGGDEMRSYSPQVAGNSINFHLLNRGKQSWAVDLKDPVAAAEVRRILERADVLIEQFRPGVMQRLGFGYDTLRAINPRLIYCSITGWGQDGPKSRIAAHDLNYMAETGLLSLSTDSHGAPVLPPVLVADLAGGALPAVINILLALRQRDLTGQGTYLDIAMGDALFNFAYWALGNAFAAGSWPKPGGELLTGGSARYQIYKTKDGRFVAAAPLEEKFWAAFCRLVDIPAALRAEAAPASVVIAAVAERIAARTAAEWRQIFAGEDVCCSIVANLREAVDDSHTRARKLFSNRLAAGDRDLPALPVPLAPVFRSGATPGRAPLLGEHGASAESSGVTAARD